MNPFDPTQSIEEEAGLPENWKPVEVDPIVPGAPPAPNSNTPRGTYYSGAISPGMQHDATLVDSKYGNGTPLNRMMPFPPAANAQVNSTIKSIIASTVTPVTPSSGMTFRGTWTNFTSYAVSDVVIFNLSAYVATQASVNKQPDNNSTIWTLLSENFVFNASATSSVTGDWGPFDSSTTSNGTSSSTATAGPLTPAITTEAAIWVVGTSSGAGAQPSGWSVLDAGAGTFVIPVTGPTPFSATDALGSSLTWATSLALFYTAKTTFTAAVTQTSIAFNVLTVVCNNSFTVGTQAILSGTSIASGSLNGVALTILTASPTQYTAALIHANVAPMSDSGTATDVGIVQSVVANPGNFGSFTLTLPNPVTPGNMVIGLVCGLDSGGFGQHHADITSMGGTVSPSTWTIINSSNGAGNKPCANMAFVQGVTSGQTVTFNVNNSLVGCRIAAIELAKGVFTAANYVPYDVEEFKGSFFVCLKETSSDAFTDPTSWGQIAQGSGAVDFLSGTYTPVLTDYGRLIENNTSSNYTVNLPTTPLSNSWWIAVAQSGTGTVTVNPGSNTIDGSSSSLVLSKDQGLMVFTDGTNYFTIRGFTAASDLIVWNTTAQSTTYAAVAGDFVLGTTTSAGFTVTLPAASANKNKLVGVKKVSSDANALTISRSGSDTIDGATTQTISIQYNSMTFLSDGTNWNLI